MHKRGFFQDVQDLAIIIKPIKESIILLESQDANLADCFFSLAQLGAAIKNIPETVHKMILKNIYLHIIYTQDIEACIFITFIHCLTNIYFIYIFIFTNHQ
jgi:hypothetical protein